eukprot:g7714.t1
MSGLDREGRGPELCMSRLIRRFLLAALAAALLGGIAKSVAVFSEATGCTIVADGATDTAPLPSDPMPSSRTIDDAWPRGEKAQPLESLRDVISDASLTGPGMRAVIVVKDGDLVAETYGQGFDRNMPLLGWSMTKTVNAALIGRLLMERRLSLEDDRLFAEWSNDDRARIAVADLLAMESGLAFNENYGTVADVTRMLFLEPDMAAFAAQRPLEAEPGSRFSYSSGSAVLLSRIWMDRLENRAEALAFPRRALFDPLEMTTALMETDASGTFVGSSYMYATARDWARFGWLLASDGVWNGTRLLPEGFVRQMYTPSRHSGGRYSMMQTWLPRREAGLPLEAFIATGHDGQSIFVIPSKRLVVVRLGLTPRSSGYDPLPLVSAVIERTGH